MKLRVLAGLFVLLLAASANAQTNSTGAGVFGGVNMTNVSDDIGSTRSSRTGITAGVFGTVRQVISFEWTPILGQVFLLITAVILLRIFPTGITGRFFRRST